MNYPKNPLFSLAFLAIILVPLDSAVADTGAHVFEKPVSTERDANFNRSITTGARSTGGSGGGMAMANSIMVTQSGRGNTVILNVNQQNTGNIVAGTSLNGGLSLD